MKNKISATKFSNRTVDHHIKNPLNDGSNYNINNNCKVNNNCTFYNNCTINHVCSNSEDVLIWNVINSDKNANDSISRYNNKKIDISNVIKNDYYIKEVADVDINDALFCHIVFRNFRPTRERDDKL